jgi:hypothetical protein
MSSQLHAPATLPLGKELPVTTEYEGGWVPESHNVSGKRKISFPACHQTELPQVSNLQPSHHAMPGHPNHKWWGGGRGEEIICTKYCSFGVLSQAGLTQTVMLWSYCTNTHLHLPVCAHVYPCQVSSPYLLAAVHNGDGEVSPSMQDLCSLLPVWWSLWALLPSKSKFICGLGKNKNRHVTKYGIHWNI